MKAQTKQKLDAVQALIGIVRNIVGALPVKYSEHTLSAEVNNDIGGYRMELENALIDAEDRILDIQVATQKVPIEAFPHRDERNWPAVGDIVIADKAEGCNFLTKGREYYAYSDVVDNNVAIVDDSGNLAILLASHFVGFTRKPSPVQAALCHTVHPGANDQACERNTLRDPDEVAGIQNSPDIRQLARETVVVDGHIAHIPTRSVHDSTVPDGSENVAP